MKRIYYLSFLLLPLILVITAIFLNHARGPYWLGTNLDPEYVYLLNSTNLANLKGVGHIDHPGTPVQVLGAVTLRVVYFFNFSAKDNFHTDVLKRPEYYLKAINIVMVILNAIMLLALGGFTFMLMGNIWLSLWLQLAPFFSITVLQFGLTRVTPEPLLFFSSTAMVLMMVFLVHLDAAANKKRALIILLHLMAFITAFGIANKITFIPMMAIPLIILPRLRNKVIYLAVAVVGFVICTLPIIRMYPRFFEWIYNLLTHSGQYGSGSSKLIAAGKYIKNLMQLIFNNPFFSIVLVLALVIVMTGLLIPKLRNISTSNIHFKCLAAAAAAQLAGLLMVSKHSASHYLLPALSLSGATVVFIFFYLKHVLDHFNIIIKYLVFPLLFFLTVSFILINPPGQFKKTIHRLNNIKEKSLALHQHVKDNYKDYAKIFYYRSSSPEYALKFGNDLSRSYHSQGLEQLYENVYFYDIWTKRFAGFDYNRSIPFKTIREKYGNKILFQGTRGVKIPGLKLKPVFDNGAYERATIPIFDLPRRHEEKKKNRGLKISLLY
ncbi:MAG: hypothetical protein GTO45_19855 [Candidatus Aminicenantes bacterium]|nr:hypothetical protein [Candidatus Aminicenantes bacterium]NIM81049.1 hypothetical protein [Candidatus Aminicenantes bacterium]NIN20426.1 hypothetical protein [Candidatus Aminicenantes bacterium]NIN44199.1 hypothetical protein [Candidatus Aminicenantes bacterium]NIN87017.1 hypothetical protein [Candidatus Aminicenantes bacterium]